MSKSLTVLALSLCVMLSACADEKVTPLTSPCVGIEDSPCGPKRPVNNKSRQTVQVVPASVIVAV